MIRVSEKVQRALIGIYETNNSDVNCKFLLWVLKSYKTNNLETALIKIEEDKNILKEHIRYVYSKILKGEM